MLQYIYHSWVCSLININMRCIEIEMANPAYGVSIRLTLT